MSEGLAALDRGALDEAQGAFTRAEAARPGAGATADALKRVDEARKAEGLAAHRARAESAEGREDWKGAAAEYEAALKLDPRVAFALTGRARSLPRAELDATLEAHLSRPERLSAEAVAREAERALDRAEEVEPAGPRLQRQRAALERLLAEARTPVGVPLRSDGVTEVVVLRVGTLGAFREKEVPLRPGSYVVVGRRRGYRDTRKTLVVSPGREAGAPGRALRGNAVTFTCLIEEDGRTRRFGEADFPLTLGGTGADIAVPGLAGEDPAAFLALDEGELYAQPRGRERLSLGGRPIAASQWLRDGDELRLRGTRIRVVWRGDRRYLQVRHLPLERAEATGPPVPRPDFQPEAEVLVRPVDFRPRPFPVAARKRALRRPPWRVVIPAVAALLAAGYLLAARFVEVRVEPEPQGLSVAGLPHLAWGATRVLLPGDYTVRAEREGYRPLERPLAVTRDRRQVARFVMERLPGLVLVETRPAAAVRVLVDGADRGTTPLPPLEVPAGEHEVSLRAEGYKTVTTRLTVAGGGEQQTVRATLVPDRAPVSFSSEPAGATVRVDGAEVGRTPVTVDLSSGSRAVAVTLAGHRPAGRTIEVVAEQPLTVPSFRLAPLPGRLRLASEPAGAAVRVDGEFRGETPLEIEVSPLGEHALRLTKAGHEAAEASVKLGLGEERSVSLVLPPRLGDVQVTGEPADAEVVVDGQVRGRPGQTLRLTAAAHEIEVRRSGYETHKVTVTPRPDFPQEVKIRLRPLNAPKPAVPQRLSAQGQDLRLVPPGRFQMGASRREPGRRANETVREVELQRPSYVSLREVTNAQFRRFQAAHSSGRFSGHDLDSDNQPVVRVTWEQAAEYCNWLSAQAGLPPVYAARGGKLEATLPIGPGFRLPTEAEWSRAARHAEGGLLKYPWGAALPAPPGSGNYADESARPIASAVLQGYDDRYPASSPVGTFRPNALGFFDLGGNVAEWVHDVYTIPPASTPLERDPAGSAAGDLHVVLGSSYLHGTVTELRFSYRDYATKPRADVGFRVARYAE